MSADKQELPDPYAMRGSYYKSTEDFYGDLTDTHHEDLSTPTANEAALSLHDVEDVEIIQLTDTVAHRHTDGKLAIITDLKAPLKSQLKRSRDELGTIRSVQSLRSARSFRSLHSVASLMDTFSIDMTDPLRESIDLASLSGVNSKMNLFEELHEIRQEKVRTLTNAEEKYTRVITRPYFTYTVTLIQLITLIYSFFLNFKLTGRYMEPLSDNVMFGPSPFVSDYMPNPLDCCDVSSLDFNQNGGTICPMHQTVCAISERCKVLLPDAGCLWQH
jgi:hypothetical protein